jgi:hypothetical protein
MTLKLGTAKYFGRTIIRLPLCTKTREYLERTAECARLAEGVEHPELKLYLTRFAASWTSGC